ncbi:damage-inducible protein CinA, partial [Escherichia coli]|nr:damage-inducible protein CinA [Escherichia coli]
MSITNAAIIIIGDEVLAGNTMDTNSNFIAKELHNIGIKVAEIFTISDDTD